MELVSSAPELSISLFLPPAASASVLLQTRSAVADGAAPSTNGAAHNDQGLQGCVPVTDQVPGLHATGTILMLPVRGSGVFTKAADERDTIME